MPKMLCASIFAFVELDDIEVEEGEELVELYVKDLIQDMSLSTTPIAISEEIEYKILNYN